MNDYESQRQSFEGNYQQPSMTFTETARDTKTPKEETRIRASVIGVDVV